MSKRGAVARNLASEAAGTADDCGIRAVAFRIAIVTPRYSPDIGGVEMHVENVARQLADKGNEVDILTQALIDTPSFEKVRDGISVRRFPIRLGGSAYPFAPGLWRYILMHSREYDVIHAHSYHATAVIPAALMSGRFVIFTPHYLGSGHSLLARMAHVPYKYVGKMVFHKVAKVICTTNAEAALVARDFPFASDKVSVLPNGVDTESLRIASAYEKEGPVVLCAGRLEEYKNIHRVIETLPHLNPDIQLAIVGDGPARSKLVALAHQLGVSSRVRFAGSVQWPDMCRWYSTADAFVTLSVLESFGMTALEAVAGGARLVASDIPAHREVAASTGCQVSLVRPDCSTTELAAAISNAIGKRPDHPVSVATWSDHADGVVGFCRQASLSGKRVGKRSFRRRGDEASKR